jgi:hypothetical protein
MKSIFKYCTIILINFTVFTPLQAAITASRDSQPIISNEPPRLDPHALEGSLNVESNPSSLAIRARRLSIQAQNLRKSSQAESLRVPLQPSNDTCNLGFYRFAQDEDLNDHHDPNEHSKNSHPSSDSEQKQKKRTPFKNRRSISINRETTQEPTPTTLDNDLHITITRKQLHCIECFCLLIGTGLGVYHALQPAPFQKRSMLANLGDQATEITRSGLPTDMIGAGFWGLNKLSSLASSGVTLVFAGFLLHKVKGWVDTIYASDTDRRINKKLDPFISDLEKLAAYIDEKFKEVDEERTDSYQTTTNIVQDQAKHAQLLEDAMTILEELTQEYEKRNPTDLKAQEIALHANTLHEEITTAVTQAHDVQKTIEDKTKQRKENLKNPITTKVKPSNCCGCKQQ